MIRLIEEMSMNAWVSICSDFYDGWILRTSNGYTKRANSINPVYESKLDLYDKIAFCEKYYKMKNLPVIYKINSDSKLKYLDNLLSEKKYIRIDDTSVKEMVIKDILINDVNNVDVQFVLNDDWINGYIECHSRNEIHPKIILKQMLEKINQTTILATCIVNGKSIGFGLGVVEREYVGILNIYINNLNRGKGYAKNIMHKILFEAKKIGATKSYLQVVKGNIPAEKLYDKFGYKEIYSYWYRKLDV